MKMITSNVRIPEEVWEKIKEIAIKEERSMNSQIIYIFKEFIEKQEEKKK